MTLWGTEIPKKMCDNTALQNDGGVEHSDSLGQMHNDTLSE
jgi:hypothetical protein